MKTYIQYDPETGDIHGSVTGINAPDLSGREDRDQIEIAEPVPMYDKRVNTETRTLEDKPPSPLTLFASEWPAARIVLTVNDPTKLRGLQAAANNVELIAEASEKWP
jgi:hypothetical protein